MEKPWCGPGEGDKCDATCDTADSSRIC